MKHSQRSIFLIASALSFCFIACAESSSTSSEDAACTPGCANGLLTVCNGDTPEKKACPFGCSDDAKSCKDDAGSGKCSPGCANAILTVCDGDTPFTTPCPNGCSDDAKSCKSTGGTGTCSPGCRNGVMTYCQGINAVTENCTCNQEGTACLDVSCQNVTCTQGTCEKGVCVTDAMKALKAGDSCDDKFTAFCKGDTAVACNAGGTVFFDDCSSKNGCSIISFTDSTGTDKDAVCRGAKALQCAQDGQRMPYCRATAGGSAISSSFECKKNSSGTMTALDLASYGDMKTCDDGCSADMTACKTSGTSGGKTSCDYSTKCNGNTLQLCTEILGTVGEFSYNCQDYGQTCVSVNNEPYCRTSCETEGEVKTECNQNSSGAYTLSYKCLKGTDGRLYWDPIDKSQKPCQSGEACNSAFDKCVAAETCSLSSFMASCEGNIAVNCQATVGGGIKTYAKCSAAGKNCVRFKDNAATCIENSMKCSSPDQSISKCNFLDVYGEVSTTYACKATYDGQLYFSDGINVQCPNGCDENTGKCKRLTEEDGIACSKSSYVEHCNENYAVYCMGSDDKAQTNALNCKDKTCLVVSNSAHSAYVECFDISDRCTSKGQVKTECVKNGAFYQEYKMECSLATDGNLYWGEVDHKDCPDTCNAAGTACK